MSLVDLTRITTLYKDWFVSEDKFASDQSAERKCDCIRVFTKRVGKLGTFSHQVKPYHPDASVKSVKDGYNAVSLLTLSSHEIDERFKLYQLSHGCTAQLVVVTQADIDNSVGGFVGEVAGVAQDIGKNVYDFGSSFLQNEEKTKK